VQSEYIRIVESGQALSTEGCQCPNNPENWLTDEDRPTKNGPKIKTRDTRNMALGTQHKGVQ